MDIANTIRELLFVSIKKKRIIKPTFLMSGLSMIGEAREFEKRCASMILHFKPGFNQLHTV